MKAKKVRAETPVRRVARLTEEAFVRRQRVPLEAGLFSGFLRTGSY